MALLSESRSLLESVIEADTSGRGATTALAHHALGEVSHRTVAYRTEERRKIYL